MPASVPFRIALFYAAVFLVIGVHVPFWPVWLKSRGLGPGEIGLILSLATWIRALAPPLVAQAIDRRGERKRPMVLLVAATLVAYGLFPLADGFWPILAVTAIAAVCFSAVVPLGENLAMLNARDHGFDYGRVRLWGSLSFIVAALAAGRLLVGRDEDLIPWLMLATLALTVVATAALPGTRAAPAPPTGRSPIVGLLSRPVFVIFLVATGLIQASHAAYYGFATIHWREAGLSDAVIGALWAEGVVAEIVLFAFSGAVVRRIGPVRLLMLGAAAGMVRWGVLGSTTDLAALVAVQWLHALTFAATHLGAMHFLARAVPREHSATAQTLYAALGVGVLMGLAMIVSGAIYGALGGGAFHAMAALSVLGALAALVLARSWRDGGRTDDRCA
jgi:PPP family 3-phenylpropionic acid transporter